MKDSKSDSESSQTWVHIFGDKMMYDLSDELIILNR